MKAVCIRSNPCLAHDFFASSYLLHVWGNFPMLQPSTYSDLVNHVWYQWAWMVTWVEWYFGYSWRWKLNESKYNTLNLKYHQLRPYGTHSQKWTVKYKKMKNNYEWSEKVKHEQKIKRGGSQKTKCVKSKRHITWGLEDDHWPVWWLNIP